MTVKSYIVLILALAAAGLAACAARAVKPEAAYYVGTWTSAEDGYGQATRSRDAVRYQADGVYLRGFWHRRDARFEETKPGESSPGFVKRWSLVPGTADVLLSLDGAEETLHCVIDGPDRFRTVYVGVEGRVVVYYVRVK